MKFSPALAARGTDLPFSPKSVVSITHEQNIVCSETLICKQLIAGHMVGSREMKRKENVSNNNCEYLPSREVARPISTNFTDTEVNNQPIQNLVYF